MNPETINPLTLPSVLLSERSHLPKTPCIYFAISAVNKVLYIGRANNPVQRWKAHHRYDLFESLGGVRIAWVEVTEPDLLPEIEAALIVYFKPLLNGARLGDQQVGGFKELRRRANLSTVDVASKLGIAESTVRNWDIGRHSPRLPIEDIPKLLEVYQCTLDEAIAAAKESRRKFDERPDLIAG